MPAKFTPMVGFQASAADRQRIADSGGPLSGDVYVQFVCQTNYESGAHDPDAPPDSHVRPSHAAFHGKVFKLSEAPVPPLDYGCRCALRYVTLPGSVAEGVLPVVDAEPVKPAAATEQWLRDNVEHVDALMNSARQGGKVDALSRVTLKAKKYELDISPRQVAEMVVDVVFGKQRRA